MSETCRGRLPADAVSRRPSLRRPRLRIVGGIVLPESDPNLLYMTFGIGFLHR